MSEGPKKVLNKGAISKFVIVGKKKRKKKEKIKEKGKKKRKKKEKKKKKVLLIFVNIVLLLMFLKNILMFQVQWVIIPVCIVSMQPVVLTMHGHLPFEGI